MNDAKFTVAIIGAGAGGLCLGMRLKTAGIGFVILEKAARLGGTWRDNTYPGCACDTQAHHYSYSFAPNPDWSRRYAEQPEILAYLERCAETYGLGAHIRFDTEVTAARFDEAAGQWTVETAAGERIAARFVVSAVGQLNRPAYPDIPGLDSFAGTAFHSALWNHGHDLAGKTIAVIGNGASALQLIPRIAPLAKRLLVFQRSPSWVDPKRDRLFEGWQKRLFRTVPWIRRLYRWSIYWRWERSWPEFLKDTPAARRKEERLAADIARRVAEPGLTTELTPDYPVGCKRVLLADDYYETLVRPNVEVVTAPIERIEPDAIVTADGRAHVIDTLVLATGFKSLEFLAPMEIEGRGGRRLREGWRDGAEAYLGITVAGFPNFFMLYGPNTNLGHNSVLFMIECQVHYTLRCVREALRRDLLYLDVKPDAMARFNRILQAELGKTAWAGGCRSWYKTASGRVTNNWSTTTYRYWWQTRRPKLRDYRLEVRRPGSGEASDETVPPQAAE